MKRKEFLLNASLLSAGFSFFNEASAALELLQTKDKGISKINPLATQNTIVIILGGGIRWEFEKTGQPPSLSQSYIRSVMPNLFQPSAISIRDMEVLLKSNLTQKILSTPFELNGKLIPRKSDTINHSDAISTLLGFDDPKTGLNSNGNFTLSEMSSFYKKWLLNIRKKERLYYHHDLTGTGRKIRGTNESVDQMLNQYLIQHSTTQKNYSDVKIDEPLPMFKEALGYIQEFKPKLSILHPRLLDVAHFDFRQSLINLNRLDYSIAWLHSQLQSINPSIAMNTNWIVLPDHGRDKISNGRMDKSKLAGFDHKTEDAKNSWMLLYGPKIKAATGIQDFLPFQSKDNGKENYVTNVDVFNTIRSLTK